MAVQEAEVLVVGAGPTGLTLAGELALADIDVAVVERRPNQALDSLRSGGLHSRTLEIFDQRGIADRFLAQGKIAQIVQFAGTALDISDFPTRHNYGLGLWQVHIEQILADWVAELGVPIHRGCEVTGLIQDATCVDVTLSDGRSMRAQYLVGCDGGRSYVRKAVGIAFPGLDATTSSLIAEVALAEEPEWGIRRDTLGMHALSKVEGSGRVRVMVTEPHVGATDPTLHDLREGLIAVYGTDYGVHSPTSIARFTDATRQAAAYREGRVLLAGDAAHVHPPDGGQGLQTGVQDAVNLGWKLAQVVKNISPEHLLDSYQNERHPVGAQVLRTTMAKVALRRPDEHTKALRETIAELVAMDGPRQKYATMLAGLDIRYDFGEGHPLLGRRVPDLELSTAEGPMRLFTRLHGGKPVFLNLGATGRFDITPWADRVRSIDATYAGTWTLPAIGLVPPPNALLIRPDGHVAWTDGPRLVEALTRWFGPPSPGRYAPTTAD